MGWQYAALPINKKYYKFRNMDNGLNYRDLQLQIDDRIYGLADRIYDEQNDKNYAEIVEDEVIELVKTEFEND